MISADNNIVRRSSKTFQKFIAQLTCRLTRPRKKFISQLLCGIVFAGDLVLTSVAARIPQSASLSAIAKRFRRQLSDSRFSFRQLLFNYLSLPAKKLDADSLFIVDLSDLAKPYAKKMENIALVRDGDKGCLVNGYWLLEVYALDKEGIIWPVVLWPYSLEAAGQLSENDQILVSSQSLWLILAPSSFKEQNRLGSRQN